MSKCWIYHKTEEPQIVDQKDAKGFYDKGWADSPAQFLDLSKQIDMTNEIEVHMVGEVMDETKTRANDSLNVKTAKKPRLLEMAEVYGVDSAGLKVKDLREAVTEAINGDGA